MIESLQEMFEEELKDIYSAEKQLVRALPKMAKAATNPKLQRGFEKHLTQTQTHVERIEEVFALLEQPAKAKTCKAMKGLVEEGTEIIEEDAEPVVKDAALIAAAQKVEHYEIATYGTLATWADQLGHGKIVKLLLKTLDEEKHTDAQLTELAETEVNAAAE